MEERPVVVRKFEEGKKRTFNLKIVLAVFLTVVVGIGSGYLLSSKQSLFKRGGRIGEEVEGEEIKKGATVGITDEKTFRDSAEGKLEKGGVDGEGSHHLVRPGGESQNVYLTSSVVDLDKFVNRKVKIWGETFSAKSAGWLMDVGKLKVLD